MSRKHKTPSRAPLHTRVHAVALAAAAAAAFLASEPALAGTVSFRVTELATPATGYAPHSIALDINNKGQVVGYVATGDETTRRAALWDGATGQVQLLNFDSSARFSEAHAINDAGQIVGWHDLAAGGFETRGALWNAANGSLSALADNGRLGSRPVDVNNDGLIVGSVIAGNGYQHAAVWRNGQLTDLGATTLRGDAFSSAAGVNNWGEIVGFGTVLGPTSGHTPLTWSGYDNSPFRVYGSYGGTAINDLGQVLSTDTVGDFADHRIVPIVINNGQVTRLLADDTEGWFTKINNAGQAVGTVNYDGAWLWSASGGALSINTRLQAGSPGVTWLSSINELGQMTAYTSNHKAAVLTPTGTLNWTGPSGGFFNDAASWDSGLGLSPNRFLDTAISSPAGEHDIIGVSYELEIKSLTVGGGAGTSRLVLIEGGRIHALEGTRLLPRGWLTVAAGSDAVFATGRLGGKLQMGAGSGIALHAGRPEDGSFDRLIIDGDFQIDGGTFWLSMIGAPAPQLGDSYDFMDWLSVSGRFDELVLPALSAGLSWDTSRLYVDGVLSVTAVPEPGSWALWLGGGVALARRLRRRD